MEGICVEDDDDVITFDLIIFEKDQKSHFLSHQSTLTYFDHFYVPLLLYLRTVVPNRWVMSWSKVPSPSMDVTG